MDKFLTESIASIKVWQQILLLLPPFLFAICINWMMIIANRRKDADARRAEAVKYINSERQTAFDNVLSKLSEAHVAGMTTAVDSPRWEREGAAEQKMKEVYGQVLSLVLQAISIASLVGPLMRFNLRQPVRYLDEVLEEQYLNLLAEYRPPEPSDLQSKMKALLQVTAILKRQVQDAISFESQINLATYAFLDKRLPNSVRTEVASCESILHGKVGYEIDDAWSRILRILKKSQSANATNDSSGTPNG